MRGLTIRQPWVRAITHLGKPEENRTRDLTGGYRGPVLLHAAVGCEPKEYEAAVAWMAERELLTSPMPPLEELPRGGFVARARIADVVRTDPLGHGWRVRPAPMTCMRCGLKPSQRGSGKPCARPSPWPFPGQHQIVVADVEPLEAVVPWPGTLVLFHVDELAFEDALALARELTAAGTDPTTARERFKPLWSRPAGARAPR